MKIEFDTGIVQLLGRVARSNLLFCLKVFPCCAFVIPIWLRRNVVAAGSGNRFLGQRTHVLSVNATSRDCPKLPQTPAKLRVGLHHPLPGTGQHPHNFDFFQTTLDGAAKRQRLAASEAAAAKRRAAADAAQSSGLLTPVAAEAGGEEDVPDECSCGSEEPFMEEDDIEDIERKHDDEWLYAALKQGQLKDLAEFEAAAAKFTAASVFKLDGLRGNSLRTQKRESVRKHELREAA